MGSQLTSFLWRLCHRVLPTQERLHHLTPATTVSPDCQACLGVRRERGEEAIAGTLDHELLTCEANEEVGAELMRVLRCYVPGLTADKALKLDFEEDNTDTDLATVTFLASVLYEVWIARSSGTRVRRSQIRADVVIGGGSVR